MKKTCKTCPFIKDTPNVGCREWLVDVFGLLAKGSLNHTCHVTDENADGYVGGEKRNCEGIKLVAENDCVGYPKHKLVFENWLSFFRHHKLRQGKEKTEGKR